MENQQTKDHEAARDIIESHRKANQINTIHLGDCIEGMRWLAPESVDLTITSPPFKDADNFSPALIRDMAAEVWRLSKPNSLFFLNFGHLAEDKARPFKVLFMAMGPGFQLAETFVWAKNHFKPIQGRKRVNNLTEFIFMLYKGEMPDLDRLSIGVPYVDKSNAKRFNNGRDLRCRGNLWQIPYQTINKKSEKLHNDRFPVGLPEFCIKLSGIPDGATVLDPFSGSATVALASKNLKKSFIGFEINPSNHAICVERLKS